MNASLDLFKAIGVAYLLAIGLLFILRAFPTTNVIVVGIITGSVMACPLLIPADRVVVRAIACLPCLELWLKLVDLSREFRRNTIPITFRESLLFLIPFPAIQVVLARRRRLPMRPGSLVDSIRILLGGSIFVFLFAALDWMSGIEVLQNSFALDHFVKLWLFVVAVESLSQFLLGLERLAGFQTTPIIRNAYLSRTVGEFWYRYNSRVHNWLLDNVFLPSGGARHPVRGVFLTFFVSATIHELGFGLATSRFDGYQFAFFMLQAPAVLASQRMERSLAGMRIIGEISLRGATITWFTVSSILFFHGVDRVFPFCYASKSWLP